MRPITEAASARADARLVHLGLTDYREAWRLQRAVAQAVERGGQPDTVIVLEHPPTVTLGRRSEASELHLPADALLEIVETDRGGRSTYHAPGQLVCYPILDLHRHDKDVRRYCRNLEQVVIDTLAAFDLEGLRIEGLTGVWVARGEGFAKIASIGVHIRRWVTTHGFALNVDLDPAPFSDWITACGLEQATFTSMAHELGRALTVEQVALAARDALAEVFALRFTALELGGRLVSPSAAASAA